MHHSGWFLIELGCQSIWLCDLSGGAAFSSSKEEVSSITRVLDVWLTTESVGSPAVATMAGPPAVVPPVSHPSMCIVNWACCFLDRLQINA